MKNYFKVLVLLTMFVGMFSACNKDENEALVEKDIRKELLLKINQKDIKESFKTLANKDKIKVWNSKFTQLLTQNLPKEHLDLIKELTVVFKEENNRNNVLLIAEKLARITPSEDYHYKGSFIGRDNSMALYQNMLKTNTSKMNNVLPDCDCSWSFLLEKYEN